MDGFVLPCEYCQAPVDADVFMRLGVPPCCFSCRHAPLILGSVIGGGCLLLVVLAAWLAW